VRGDVGHEIVTSKLRMMCFDLLPGGPDCRDPIYTEETSSVGGITLMAGLELRFILKAPGGRT
jgi:hypothetical protein